MDHSVEEVDVDDAEQEQRLGGLAAGVLVVAVPTPPPSPNLSFSFSLCSSSSGYGLKQNFVVDVRHLRRVDILAESNGLRRKRFFKFFFFKFRFKSKEEG